MDFQKTLSFSITGPGEILATDNGDPTCMQAFHAPERKAFHGLALAIVRAKKGQSGTIVLMAEAEGLEGAAMELEIN